MELMGNAEGIAALKAKHLKDKSYLKFLVTEARSNIDQTATFTAEDGKKWKLRFDAESGNLDVQPAA